MFNKEEYNKEVFEKYNNLKTKNKLHFPSFCLEKICGIIAIGTLIISATAFAYTEIKNIRTEQNIEQSIENQYINNSTNFPKTEFSNGIYYHNITNIEDYKYYKSLYNNLIEMSEEDFKNNFLFVVFPFGETYISDISNDGNSLIIKITRKLLNFDEDIYPERKVISAKISKELYRENVIIKVFQEDLNLDSVSLEDVIEQNYTKEQSINAGYIVTEFNENDYQTYLISDNQNKLDEFIENTQKNNTESMIRCINYSSNIITYRDIMFSDGIYTVYTYYKYINNDSASFSCYNYGTLLKKENMSYNISGNSQNKEYIQNYINYSLYSSIHSADVEELSPELLICEFCTQDE